MRLTRTRLWLLARLNPSLAIQFRELKTEATVVRKSLAAADAALGELHDRVKRLNGRMQALEGELRDERHEHAKTAKQLELAGEENRLLAAIHETDVVRRKREQAILDRERAEAETAVLVARRRSDDEEGETSQAVR